MTRTAILVILYIEETMNKIKRCYQCDHFSYNSPDFPNLPVILRTIPTCLKMNKETNALAPICLEISEDAK